MLEERDIYVGADGRPMLSESAPEGAETVTAIVRMDGAGVAEYWLRLSAAKATLIGRMRDNVALTITDHLSLEDQTNIQAASIALVDARLADPETPVTPEVSAAADAMRTCLGWIRAVRTAGRTSRSAIEDAADAEALNAVDMTLPAPPLDAIGIAKAATL